MRRRSPSTDSHYRSKRSDKFKGFEKGLFDIADEPWIARR